MRRTGLSSLLRSRPLHHSPSLLHRTYRTTTTPRPHALPTRSRWSPTFGWVHFGLSLLAGGVAYHFGARTAEQHLPFGELDDTLFTYSAPRTASTVPSTITPWMLHHPVYQHFVHHHKNSGSSNSTVILPSRPPGPSLTSGALRGEKRIQGSLCVLQHLDDPREESPDTASVMLLDVGPALCGYPGVVHGGVTATIIDEALGRLAAAALGDGRRPVTANLKIQYKKPIKVERHYTPPGWDNVQSGNDKSNNNGGAKDSEFAARIVVRSWVVKKDTKRGKVWVKAEVHPAEGYVLPELRMRELQEESRRKCLATGEALFVVPRGFKPPPIVGEMGGLGSDDVEKS